MTDDRELLDILAEEFLAKVRQGDDVGVEDYAQAHPDLADDIRELFPALYLAFYPPFV